MDRKKKLQRRTILGHGPNSRRAMSHLAFAPSYLRRNLLFSFLSVSQHALFLLLLLLRLLWVRCIPRPCMPVTVGVRQLDDRRAHGIDFLPGLFFVAPPLHQILSIQDRRQASGSEQTLESFSPTTAHYLHLHAAFSTGASMVGEPAGRELRGRATDCTSSLCRSLDRILRLALLPSSVDEIPHHLAV